MAIHLRALGAGVILALVLALALLAAAPAAPAARSLDHAAGATHDLAKGCPSVVLTC